MLMVKNITKEIFKNKIFLVLLFVATVCTSFLFFFIRFSIDANLVFLQGLGSLTPNQQNYLRALNSNRSLALSVLFAVAAITALVFVLFYSRFFSGAKKQIGILKAAGYSNLQFQAYFSAFAVLFSLVGLLTGMLIGYFASSVHLAANSASYNVSGLTKGISAGGVLLGIGLPLILFGLTMFLCGFTLYRKENAALLNGAAMQKSKKSGLLKFADACVQKLPIKNKAPLRLALRRPLSGLIIVAASMVFTVMLVLGWSLTVSGNTIYQSQTIGHNYLFESKFNSIQTERAPGKAIHYLSFDGSIESGKDGIEQTIVGTEFDGDIYVLQNMAGEKLGELTGNSCYIGEELQKMHGISVGEDITIHMGGTQIQAKVQDVAFNIKLKTIVLGRDFVARQMGYDVGSFNGALTMEPLYSDASVVIDSAEREDALQRNKVSSSVSAVINQSVGLLAGTILIFLALFITFLDSTKDMLILGHLGFSGKEVKRLLINIFLPVLIVGFFVTAYPSVLIAKAVQFSLSLQTGDYMPFSTNIVVTAVGLIAVAAIYFAVQATFGLVIRSAIKKKSILQYTNEL